MHADIQVMPVNTQMHQHPQTRTQPNTHMHPLPPTGASTGHTHTPRTHVHAPVCLYAHSPSLSDLPLSESTGWHTKTRAPRAYSATREAHSARGAHVDLSVGRVF